MYFSIIPVSGHQGKRDEAYTHVLKYEKAIQHLLPWIPDTLTLLEGLITHSSKHQTVAQTRTEIEAS